MGLYGCSDLGQHPHCVHGIVSHGRLPRQHHTVRAIQDGVSIGGGRFNSTSRVNFAVILNALANDADSNILSTPSLVTLDNQEAEIIVGQNVPFVTGEFTNTGAAQGSVNPFRTIERQDVGVTLRVTPQINEGDAIKLEIEQEVSNVIPSTTGATDLTTSKRSIKTTVMVEDGRTGFVVDDVAGAVEAVSRLPSIDRGRCRRTADGRFSIDAMAEGYGRVYRSVVRGTGVMADSS